MNKNIFKVYVNDVPVDVNIFKFSGGETQVKVDCAFDSQAGSNVLIVAHIREGDIMPLALLVDAIRRTIKTPKIRLVMPYLPYARQDRVMNPGESLAVKVFCDFINSLNFDSVAVSNCHSDVGLALLNNCEPQLSEGNLWFLLGSRFDGYDALVAPDAGALKKTQTIGDKIMMNVIRGDKTRNTLTGQITGSTFYGDVKGKTLLIVDDIADGGFTFISLAQELKKHGAKVVDLYVTHGIFSKGKKALLDNGIDSIITQYDWEFDRNL